MAAGINDPSPLLLAFGANDSTLSTGPKSTLLYTGKEDSAVWHFIEYSVEDSKTEFIIFAVDPVL